MIKLLRLNAYFNPEITAATHLMDDLYEAFFENDIQCISISPDPTRGVSEEVRKEYKNKRYEELNNGYLIAKRFPMFKEGRNPILRALRYFLCSFFQYHEAIKEEDVDVMFSGSTPPTNGIISSLVCKKLSKKYGKKVPFIYELQDIFPDSLVNSKMISENSITWKVGRKIEDYIYKKADVIIVPSYSMKKNILNKGVSENKVEVISNWIDLNEVRPIPRNENILMEKLGLSNDDFIVVYAGNFGEVQGADIVLKVAKELKEYKKIKFVIFGGGSGFEDAKKEAKLLENVIINDLLPLKYVSYVYSLGDVALITCKPGTGNAGMPSKTWSIMACNTPIIASFDLDSDLHDVLEKSNSGICVNPGDLKNLVHQILNVYNDEYHFDNNLRSYVNDIASKEFCVNKYIDVLLHENNN